MFDNPSNNDKPWDSSVKDLDLEILCVSQVKQSEGKETMTCISSVLLLVVHFVPRPEGQQA